jgi:uroporphyrin-III C-methyltransferase / precorrin-2 dehydrogenase / sirohydrochlorin ferrochelatase
LQRGVIAVERADVVVADRLAPLELLAELSPHLEVIEATKIPTGEPWPRTPSMPS